MRGHDFYPRSMLNWGAMVLQSERTLNKFHIHGREFCKYGRALHMYGRSFQKSCPRMRFQRFRAVKILNGYNLSG